MRRTIILLALITSHIGVAQGLKTIYTNEHQVVSLFFPNAIRQAVVGSKNFVFSYNREIPQNYGLLQGTSGTESNLLVITQNGDVYSYLLAHEGILDTLSYFVRPKDRIYNIATKTTAMIQGPIIKPGDTPTEKTAKTLAIDNQVKYYRNFSSYQLKSNRNSLKRKRKKGLALHLKDLVYNRSEVYAIIDIKNRSKIDLEVDYVKIFKVNGNHRKKASYQKLPLTVLYRHNFPKVVKSRENTSLILAVPKFTLGDSEKLWIELKEKNGGRTMGLGYK